MLRNLRLSKEVGRTVKRLSSTQVVAQEQNGGKISTTKLPNGLTVVTENGACINANISLIVKAGSRYESPSNVGVSHTLRAAACLTSDQNSALMTTQLLSALGGSLDVSATREHVSYNLRCGKKVWKNVFYEVLVPTLFGGRFFWWEVDDISKVMKYQIAEAKSDPNFQLMEAVHRASFGGGLGNSILCPEDCIGSHTTESLKDFFNKRYGLNNIVLAGNGIGHEELCDIGSTIRHSSGSSSDKPNSRFVASEVRVQEKGDVGRVGLSFSGTSLNDQDTIALAVLQNVLGSGCNTKRESGQVSRLNAAASKKTSNPVSVGCYNVNYSDAGLLGIYIQGASSDIGGIVSAVSDEVKSFAGGKITDEEVAAGKMNLKANLMMSSESSSATLEDIAIQTSVLGGSIPASEIASKVDSITTAQVGRVAKKVLGGPKSLAAVGDIAGCPYLSEL